MLYSRVQETGNFRKNLMINEESLRLNRKLFTLLVEKQEFYGVFSSLEVIGTFRAPK